MIVTFIGHRNIQFDNDLRLKLKEIILSLVDNRSADTFLLGSKSDFDSLCFDVLTDIKKDRPHIKLVYVRAAYPYISESYTKYLLSLYDETYIPDSVIHAGRAAYVKRNYHMIDKADLCIFYYNENYEPTLKPATRKQLLSHKPKSGTKVAYEYATLKKKKILNLYLD